jgi:uncharacterized membrane protein YeaQ/YmgE (transglycosylase-associated protein family)
MEGSTMINLLLWLVVGALAGWLAGHGMDDLEGTPLNILIAIVGALINGFLVNYIMLNLFNLQYAFNLTALLAAFFGAVVLLVIVKQVRRGSVRSH